MTMPAAEAWRVLLIDDSVVSLEVAETALKEAGFDVRSTATLDGFDAQVHAWSPQVILTDVNMPGMTGNELCKSLKRRYETAHVPVVLWSSLPQDELEVLARQCEADGFVSKGGDTDQLAEELRALCESLLW